jgi:hypothetical protein
MKGDEKLVFDHSQGRHTQCSGHTDFPESELQFEARIVHQQRRAEWRHYHGDHSLCKREYVLGCTPEEVAEAQRLSRLNKERYSKGNADDLRDAHIDTLKRSGASKEALEALSK